MSEITRILAALDSASGQPAVLATLVQVEGSSYRRPGARLLLLPDGARVGSISGGCLDQDVIERAKRVLQTGQAELAVYDTTEENDLMWGVGQGCQGIVRIFLEYIPPERPEWLKALRTNQHQRRDTIVEVIYNGIDAAGTRLSFASSDKSAFRETVPSVPALLILGAGDDARPLLRMAKEMSWHVTITDTRPFYITQERFPEADYLLRGTAEEIVGQLQFDARTFAVVMTRRFNDDLIFLRALLSTDIRYVGQLGARKRTERLLAQLKTDGFVPGAERLACLHAPVGLDLGADSSEAVALSILAEIQARLAGRTPGYLRDRIGPIHD